MVSLWLLEVLEGIFPAMKVFKMFDLSFDAHLRDALHAKRVSRLNIVLALFILFTIFIPRESKFF